MSDLRFNGGGWMSGLLVDGVADTPFTGATLKMSDRVGIEVDVPYVRSTDNGQFDHVDRWFRAQEPPKNLQLLVEGGAVSLFDTRWHGYRTSGHHLNHGVLRPTEAVFADRDGPIEAPLAVREVRSDLDGLNEWTRFSAVERDRESTESGGAHVVIFRVSAHREAIWTQGEAQVSLRLNWQTRDEANEGRRVVIDDNVALESVFEEPRPFADHLLEQRKVANLLSLLFGSSISFRNHYVRDETFSQKYASGKVAYHPFVELVSTRTVRERALPRPAARVLSQPLASFADVGVNGLERWSTRYAAWQRFILPAINSFRQTAPMVEDAVLNLCMSLEGASAQIGVQSGEKATYARGRPSTATHIYRCVYLLQLDRGPRVENYVGLARAIANVYNDIKHADRGDFPEFAKMSVTAAWCRWIVRCLALHLLRSEALSEDAMGCPSLSYELSQSMEAWGLRITGAGGWEPVSS
jgi:hypothetical protein